MKNVCLWSFVRRTLVGLSRQGRMLIAASTIMCCGVARGQPGSPAAVVPAQHGVGSDNVAKENTARMRSVRVVVTLRTIADSGEEKVLSSMQRRLMEEFPLLLDADISTPSGRSSRVGLAVEASLIDEDVCLRAFWTLQPFVDNPPVRVCGHPGVASLRLEQEISPGFRVQIEIQTVADARQ